VIGSKDSRQFFSQWEATLKPTALCTRDFFRVLSEVQVIARNYDWSIALFAPIVIDRSNPFGFGFSTVIWKQLYVYRVFPESLRWLVVQGRLDDAHVILMKYADKSSVEVDSDTLSSMLQNCEASETKLKTWSKRSPLELVRTPRMRKRTLILCYNW